MITRRVFAIVSAASLMPISTRIVAAPRYATGGIFTPRLSMLGDPALGPITFCDSVTLTTVGGRIYNIPKWPSQKLVDDLLAQGGHLLRYRR